MPSLIPSPEVDATLDVIGDWTRTGSKIKAVFKFDSFRTAFDFMTAVAPLAEQYNHHPEWSNIYDTVTVELTTHDYGGITDLDLDMARRISRLAADRIDSP